jgi:hypothetical protein
MMCVAAEVEQKAALAAQQAAEVEQKAALQAQQSMIVLLSPSSFCCLMIQSSTLLSVIDVHSR